MQGPRTGPADLRPSAATTVSAKPAQSDLVGDSTKFG